MQTGALHPGLCKRHVNTWLASMQAAWHLLYALIVFGVCTCCWAIHIYIYMHIYTTYTYMDGVVWCILPVRWAMVPQETESPGNSVHTATYAYVPTLGAAALQLAQELCFHWLMCKAPITCRRCFFPEWYESDDLLGLQASKTLCCWKLEHGTPSACLFMPVVLILIQSVAQKRPDMWRTIKSSSNKRCVSTIGESWYVT